jgi:pSer/pThr/pTyr-binding forkhead associated (FHA) protein
MYQIICPTCLKPSLFKAIENKPVECSFCFTTFYDSTPFNEVNTESKGKLSGLKLVYQQNSESIFVSGNTCIIGRENIGAALLSGILNNGNPVISRRHCSVTFTDGKYWLKDEGSRNGTYYGVSKIDCSGPAQVIEDNSIIYLGREAFLVQFQYEETKTSGSQQTAVDPKETNKPHKFRCNEGCGFESDTYLEICPKCMTSNSMVEVL